MEAGSAEKGAGHVDDQALGKTAVPEAELHDQGARDVQAQSRQPAPRARAGVGAAVEAITRGVRVSAKGDEVNAAKARARAHLGAETRKKVAAAV